ncbi:ankyrin repeat and ibr domain containing protein, putative [Perkinsus marinus ATCC 50983]|uniref:RBR-type E3 ubiquitin transferase n=1 Tax=Perkinsus marinus (strain ATCC 50983 / TXsc) TaxID=423536 RepID=C5LHQ0_PERM5|nr:ankyrin repeat and ibr domain containing protein, putative [Perkinsus marinus ATCC 50983]EER03653.1 ankyrin repeat and ibr domain containing protein, putative [Perkinsus marinus ATCC 50983]|eukprot:XP_002771837.1 ankyrin repeat and ibr domain containing protein, putative [Perkinsus marinus ATCC 50983]
MGSHEASSSSVWSMSDGEDDDSAALDEFHYYDDCDVEISNCDSEGDVHPHSPVAAEDASFRMETDSPADVHVLTSGGDVPTEGGEEEEDVQALSAQIMEPLEVANSANPDDDSTAAVAITTTPVKEPKDRPSSATPVTGLKSLKGSTVKQPAATAENILAAKDDSSVSARISCANFCVMAAADLVRISREKAARVTELLNVTLDDAFALMKEFGWEELPLQEAWFSEARGEDWVREKCGVFKSSGPTSDGSTRVTCKVCYCEELLKDCVLLDGCSLDHVTCKDCFAQYVSTKLSDVGRGAPDARCVMHKCERRRGCGRAVLKFSHPKDVHRSGGRGSSIAVESDTVVCDCGYCWCFSCQREAHEPASCQQVYDWEVKNSNESENVSWILANTKQCPRCGRPIEKNQGCNHMRCSESGGGCGQEFCWLCLTPWAQHGQSTGGLYSCNIYERNTRDDTEEGRRQREGKAKHSLQKYMFHYERYVNHERAANLAREVSELGFITSALQQVVECRRVLKWTYVYGYYLNRVDEDSEGDSERDLRRRMTPGLSDHWSTRRLNHGNSSSVRRDVHAAVARRQLFEFLQKNLEEKTEALHELIEKDLEERFIRSPDESTDPAAPGGDPSSSTPLAGDTTMTSAVDIGLRRHYKLLSAE